MNEFKKKTTNHHFLLLFIITTCYYDQKIEMPEDTTEDEVV